MTFRVWSFGASATTPTHTRIRKWQGYAAAVAAAYAKDLLLVVAIDQINSTPTARDTLADSGERISTVLLK
jgi:hypothetical protein